MVTTPATGAVRWELNEVTFGSGTPPYGIGSVALPKVFIVSVAASVAESRPMHGEHILRTESQIEAIAEEATTEEILIGAEVVIPVAATSASQMPEGPAINGTAADHPRKGGATA